MCAHCYKAAGEESRNAILRLLKRKELNVGELAKTLKLKQPTVTHHLKKLTEVGLVSMTKDGREHRYRLQVKSECFSECGLLEGL